MGRAENVLTEVKKAIDVEKRKSGRLHMAVGRMVQVPDLDPELYRVGTRKECLTPDSGVVLTKVSPLDDDPQVYLSSDSLDLANESVPYPPPPEPEFRFIDLFAGIGDFRIAFQQANGNCVFTSEWDPHAQRTYEASFGDRPFGDIRKIPKESIPDQTSSARVSPVNHSRSRVSRRRILWGVPTDLMMRLRAGAPR